ncbi:hypothetical protein JXB02_04990 [Candidatus Woesearchaeota archaeon]|nr:hypothetical protein [Candidatus Woesearchaeota archaeon]
MARAAKKAATPKIKKKRWVHIYGKDVFNDRFLGETPTTDLSTLPGKELKVNLMTVTNDIKKQHINLTFRIEAIEGDKAVASPVRYLIIPAHIKRIVRRKRDKIELSFLVRAKDGVVARIKPLIVTRNPTYQSVQSAIRKAAEGFVIEHFRESEFQKVMNEIVSSRFQMALRDAVKGIYPVRSVEVRELRVATEKEAGNTKAIRKDPPIVPRKKGLDRKPDRRLARPVAAEQPQGEAPAPAEEPEEKAKE